MIKTVKLSMPRLVAMAALSMLCMFSLMVATQALAAGARQNFMLHNNTGFTINKVFTSPTTANEWQEDVLGRDTLPNGQSVHIIFSPKEEADKWDLKVEDLDGKTYQWYDLDLNKISDITLHWDKDSNKGTDEEKER